MADEARAPSKGSTGLVFFARGRSAGDVAREADRAAGSGQAYWLGYRADRTCFEYRDPHNEQQQVSLWPTGRVFGPGREVRWEQEADGYAVWVLTEEETAGQALVAAGFRAAGGPWHVVEEPGAPIFLWGRYDRHEECWVEVKIPHFQKYPTVPPGKDEKNTEKLFARLVAVYYQAENGAVQFTRLKGVQ